MIAPVRTGWAARPVARAVIAALMALMLVAAVAFGSTRAQRLATAAPRDFANLLHQSYGPYHGYSTCPPGQLFGSEIQCTAEFEQYGTWNRVGAIAHVNRTPISFSALVAIRWTRRWSPYTHRIIAGFGATGVASVNTPAEDWSFIGGGIYYAWKQHKRTATVGGYDGPDLGLQRFYSFHCDLRTHPIVCMNRFGDAIRYRPAG